MAIKPLLSASAVSLSHQICYWGMSSSRHHQVKHKSTNSAMDPQFNLKLFMRLGIKAGLAKYTMEGSSPEGGMLGLQVRAQSVAEAPSHAQPA